MYRSGWLKGVLNIAYGLGSKVGQAISEHPDIKAISFTGGTATGKTIAATAAPMFKKLSLELGGKNPTSFLPIAILTQQVPVFIQVLLIKADMPVWVSIVY